MKKIGMLVLAACLLLSLAACGKNTETKKDTEEPINGVINRLGDYLVLLGSDENYHIFDLGEGVDKESLAEGDSVKVFYVGELDREDPAPVAVSIEKIDS